MQVGLVIEGVVESLQPYGAFVDLGNGLSGHIGIVGPKRMDYENVMDSLKNIQEQLDVTLKKNRHNDEK